MADYQQAKTMEEIRKEREEDKLHQFLMGLDETEYGAIKSSLVSRVPLRTLDEAYNALVQDEESKHLGWMNTERVDGVSFPVQPTRSKSSHDRKGGSVTCTNCGRPGHVTENCFRLIGYPDWWEDNQKQRS